MVFCFLFELSSISQNEARFTRLDRNKGLSHNNVYSIIQDSYGFMWFGTQDGLNRYDGYSFKQYYHESRNSNSLISSNFGKILEDDEGYLWFGTHFNGLDRYDPIKNEFKHFVNNESDDATISSNHIRALAKDKAGNIWVATSGAGLNCLHKRTQTFIRYLHVEEKEESISSNHVNAIVVDENNNLWIGTNASLDFYDTKARIFKHYTLGYESFDQRQTLSIRALLLAENGVLWIGTSNGLYTFNRKTRQFKKYTTNIANRKSLSDNLINTIYQDSFGNIWIGTEHGLNKYNVSDDSFDYYLYDALNPFSLSNNRVWSICEDRSKNLWIGTKGGGVNKLDLKRKKFHNIGYNPNQSFTLSHPSVSSIVADTSGNIWVGTDGGGACMLKMKDKQIECFNQKFNDLYSLSGDQVWSSCYGDGKIWLGMHTRGLDLIEKNKNGYTITNYRNNGDSTGISNNQVNCITYDNKGFLWVGTRDGLDKMIDTVGNNTPYFISYQHSYADSNSLSDNYITAVYQDHKGYMWVGTYDRGLNSINLKTNEIKRYLHEQDNENSISDNSIHTIFEDHLGIIWIGTAGGGLNKLDKNRTSFRQYDVNSGLPSNEIMAIKEDHSGFLWISTSKGLSKFDPINEEFIKFDISDGIISDGFNRNVAWQSPTGQLFFGTNSGLVFFHPKEIKLNSIVPEIIITGFTFLNEEKWATKDIFVSKDNQGDNKIVLDYDKNIFSIEFAALDFTEPKENMYQYKIDEINDNWIDYGNKRSIMITNLEPGKYTLRIRGTNNDKFLNTEGIQVPIIVKPPFWKTKIFFLIIGVLSLLLAVWIYSFFVKLKTNKILALKNKELEYANIRLQESEASLKELNETKDKFFSIIAHDLRNPFNPLLALTELLDDDYNDLDENERREFIKEIRHGAKRLYDLLENLLHWALSQTKQIKFKKVELDLNQLIQNNIDLLTINAEKKNISIVKNFDTEVRVSADENMVNSIIRNLLNNAIKFSGDGAEIFVNVADDKDMCTIEVKDNGVGIPAENLDTIFKGISKSTINNSKGKGTGLGLILCNEFVLKNDGEIWVESEVGKGSSFFFTLNKT